MAPVLYASQWFLTLFSCPFPAAFSCRIIDTVLAEGHSEILQQARFLRCSSPGNHRFHVMLAAPHCDESFVEASSPDAYRWRWRCARSARWRCFSCMILRNSSPTSRSACKSAFRLFVPARYVM